MLNLGDIVFTSNNMLSHQGLDRDWSRHFHLLFVHKVCLILVMNKSQLLNNTCVDMIF